MCQSGVPRSPYRVANAVAFHDDGVGLGVLRRDAGTYRALVQRRSIPTRRLTSSASSPRNTSNSAAIESEFCLTKSLVRTRLDQLNSFADGRLIVGCIYCGGLENTREHVPSRVFLDAPFPENLPVVGACRSCNNGFSLDEEYFACLVESVIAGSTDPKHIKRPGVANILRRTPTLRARIEAAKTCVHGQTHFAIEPERVKNVVVKLARGHAAYELSQPCKNEPSSVWWHPLVLMDEAHRDEFESSHVVESYGEIGSRGMQRLLVAQFTLQSDSGETKTVDLLTNRPVKYLM
ncbi:hypothetical protein SAMN05446635_2674 [Burkholderia sp. OK233]|nr:hypothetical protein SAMN05446635_2674 [Burkholderia sp. OK233]